MPGRNVLQCKSILSITWLSNWASVLISTWSYTVIFKLQVMQQNLHHRTSSFKEDKTMTEIQLWRGTKYNAASSKKVTSRTWCKNWPNQALESPFRAGWPSITEVTVGLGQLINRHGNTKRHPNPALCHQWASCWPTLAFIINCIITLKLNN